MNQCPATCTGCPLFTPGKVGFVPDESKPSKVAVLALSPSTDDLKGRQIIGYAGPKQPIYESTTPKPFIGSNGWMLTNTFLPAAGLSRETTSLHHLIKCHLPPSVKGDTLKAAMDHCSSKHLTIPDEVEVVATIGEEPWQFLQGPLPLKDWRGFTGPTRYRGKHVYATGSLSDIMGDPHLRFVTRLDWKKIPKIYRGEYPLPIPTQCIASPSNRGEFIRKLDECLEQTEITCDTEYLPKNNLLTHIGAAWKTPSGDVTGFQLEWLHGAATTVERAIFIRYWKKICEKVRVAFWNSKADIPVIEQNLHIIPEMIEDPMQAHACLWSDMPHDYEFVCSLYGKYPKLKHLSKENILLYHWGDLIDLVWLWEQLKDELKKDPGCEKKYRQQNLKVLPIVMEREREGIKVNQSRIEAAIPEYQALTHSASALATAYCGFPINLGSPSQLLHYLASGEGIQLRGMDQDLLAQARTKFHPFDPDQEEKEGFSVGYVCSRVALGAHPLLETRTMYAQNKQITSHYLEPLLGIGRIYPQINIHTQAGGRHSITKPALATLPNDLRDIIQPDENQVWISWDWDQQEPRIMWGESGSKVLERAFTQGEDIHTSLVCDLYGWKYPSDRRDPHNSSIDAGWREQHNWTGKEDPRRVFSKNVRYECAYSAGGSAFNAQQKATRMGIEPGIAKKAAETLLNSDPELAGWFKTVQDIGLKTRMVRSWDGGRRVFYWADGLSKVPLNEMRNFPPQGGGAGLYNLTIVEIAKRVPEAKFVYGLHDSQYWSVPKDKWEVLYPQIKQIAEQERLISGKLIKFPGSFKLTFDDGSVKKI